MEKNLVTTLFEMTKAAETKFLSEARELDDHPESYAWEEIDVYRHRWCALLDVIEYANMFERYSDWRSHQKED